MQAVLISEHGGLDQLTLQELPTPEPGAGEVRIRVKACALNHMDLWVRRGVPGHRFPLPLIPGCDIAGEIDALGSGVSGLTVGDKAVVAPGVSCGHCEHCLSGWDPLCAGYGILGETQHGGCAEYLVIPSRNVLPFPEGLSFSDAAAYPLTFLTAWHMLVARAAVKAGETVLVQAGGSGVGSAAIQIAKLHGARVITTVGRSDKVERARELGADHVINYHEQDVVQSVRAITGRDGVHVIIDHVGQQTWETDVRCLARGGRIVICGATSGPAVQLHLNRLFIYGHTILGSTMGSLAELHQISRLIARGELRPVVHCVLPLAEIRRAHQVLEGREAFGKVVVTP